MTRDEAIYRALAVEYPPGSVVPCLSIETATEVQNRARRDAELFVDRAVALGLLKLDEPKRVHEEAFETVKFRLGGRVFSGDVAQVIDCLNANGFKIVKA